MHSMHSFTLANVYKHFLWARPGLALDPPPPPPHHMPVRKTDNPPVCMELVPWCGKTEKQQTENKEVNE